MIDRSENSILPEVIFSKCNTKRRNEKYILCDSIFLTEFFHLLYGNLRDLSAVKLCGRNCSTLIRIELNTSICLIKYRFIVILCLFVCITLQRISVIECKIIGGIFFCFEHFSCVSSVNIIYYDCKRCSVCNDVMNVKEQIISITGSVNFKPEEPFIKQHIWANQSFSVHSIYDLCFADYMIVAFLKNIPILIHKKSCF